MITVLVTYSLPEGTDRTRAHSMSQQAAPRFQGIPGLVSKHFLFHEDEKLGGGFYTWKSREEAEAFHSDAWLDSMEERMGSRPTLTFFETAVLVDNTEGQVLVEAA